MNEQRLALFLMLGQTASKQMGLTPELVPPESLKISPSVDLSLLIPEAVHTAIDASEGYRLFFVFEVYLRELIVEVLSKDGTEEWWGKVPSDVQTEVQRLEETEDMKTWMSLGSRNKSALMTLPQLLRTIDHNWKDYFEDMLRDKGLIQEARLLVHLRNTLCHMSTIPEEEMSRIRQVMRDWFRVVAP
jgi:hypothetical protein